MNALRHGLSYVGCDLIESKDLTNDDVDAYFARQQAISEGLQRVRDERSRMVSELNDISNSKRSTKSVSPSKEFQQCQAGSIRPGNVTSRLHLSKTNRNMFRGTPEEYKTWSQNPHEHVLMTRPD